LAQKNFVTVPEIVNSCVMSKAAVEWCAIRSPPLAAAHAIKAMGSLTTTYSSGRQGVVYSVIESKLHVSYACQRFVGIGMPERCMPGLC
jgi:hypothetical protein